MGEICPLVQSWHDYCRLSIHCRIGFEEDSTGQNPCLVPLIEFILKLMVRKSYNLGWNLLLLLS